MSKNINNKTKEVEGEYKVPEFKDGEVWIANWRDDIPEESEAENAQVEFEFYPDEKKYHFVGELSEQAKALLAVRALRTRLREKAA